MQRTESIRFRVSPEEKAELERRAGEGGMSAFIRERTLGSTDAPAERVSEPSLPAQTWGARVRQLVMQGVPQRSAEQMADQEWRSK